MKEMIDFIAGLEGLKLKAYLCPAGVWTIGLGSTFYADGRHVKEGDKITLDEAYHLAEFTLLKLSTFLKKCLKRPLNNNQFLALLSMLYNVGESKFLNSIILKMVNLNPNDPGIKDQFLRSFITAKGKPCPGLVNRRQNESFKYFQ
jgi:lysozyme